MNMYMLDEAEQKFNQVYTPMAPQNNQQKQQVLKYDAALDVEKKRQINKLIKIYNRRKKKKRTPILDYQPSSNPKNNQQLKSKAHEQVLKIFHIYKKNEKIENNEIKFRYNLFVFLNCLITQLNTQLQCPQIKISRFSWIKKCLLCLHSFQLSVSLDQQFQLLKSIKSQLAIQYPTVYVLNKHEQKRINLINQIAEIISTKTEIVYRLFPSTTNISSDIGTQISYSPESILNKFIEIQTDLISFLQCCESQIILLPTSASQPLLLQFNAISIPKIINKTLDLINQKIKFGDSWTKKLSNEKIRSEFQRFQVDPSAIQQIWGYCMSICALIRIGNSLQLDQLRIMYQPNADILKLAKKINLPWHERETFPINSSDNNNIKQMVSNLKQDSQLMEQIRAFKLGRTFLTNPQKISDQRLAEMSETCVPQSAYERLQQQYNDDNPYIQSKTPKPKLISLKQQAKKGRKSPVRRVYSRKKWDNIQDKNRIIFSKCMKYIYKIYVIFVNITVNVVNNINIQNFVLPHDLQSLKLQIPILMQSSLQIQQLCVKNLNQTSLISNVVNLTRVAVQKTQQIALNLEQMGKKHQIQLNNVNDKIQKLNLTNAQQQIKESLKQIYSAQLEQKQPDLSLIQANLKLLATREDMSSISDDVNVIHQCVSQINSTISDYGPKMLEALGFNNNQISDILTRQLQSSLQTVTESNKKQMQLVKNTLTQQISNIQNQQAALRKVTAQFQSQSRINQWRIQQTLNSMQEDVDKILQKQNIGLQYMQGFKKQLQTQYQQGLKRQDVPLQHIASLKQKIEYLTQNWGNIQNLLKQGKNHDIGMTEKLNLIDKQLANLDQNLMDNNEVFLEIMNKIQSQINQKHQIQLQAIQKLSSDLNTSTNRLMDNSDKNKRQLILQFQSRTDQIIQTLKDYQIRIKDSSGQTKAILQKQLQFYNMNLANWMQTLKHDFQKMGDKNNGIIINQVINSIRNHGFEQTNQIINYIGSIQQQVNSSMIQLNRNNSLNNANLMNYLNLMHLDQNHNLHSLQNQSNNQLQKMQLILESKTNEIKYELNSQNKLAQIVQQQRSDIINQQSNIQQLSAILSVNPDRIKTQIIKNRQKYTQTMQNFRKLAYLMNLNPDTSGIIQLYSAISLLKTSTEDRKNRQSVITGDLNKNQSLVSELRTQVNQKNRLLEQKSSQLKILEQSHKRSVHDLERNYKQQLSKIQKQFVEAKISNNLFNEKVKGLQKYKMIKQQQIQNLKSQLVSDSPERERKKLKQQLRDLQIDLRKMQNNLNQQIDKQKNNNKKLYTKIYELQSSLTVQRNDLELQLKTQRQQKQRLAKTKSDVMQKSRQVYQQNKELKNEKEKLIQELKVKTKQLEQISPQNKQRKQRQLKQRQLQIQQLKRKSQKMISQLKMEHLQQIEKERKKSHNNEVQKQRKIQKLTQQFKSDIDVLTKKNNLSINEKDKQLQIMKIQRKNDEQKKQNLKKQIEELKKQISNINMKMKELEAQNIQLSKVIKQHEINKEKHKAQKQIYQKQIKTLKQSFDQKQKQISQLNSMKNKLQAAQSQNQILIKKQKSKINNIQNQFELKKQVEKYKSKLMVLQNQKQLMGKQKRHIQQQNERKTKRITEQLSQFKTKVLSINVNTSRLQQNLKQKEIQLESTQTQLKTKQNELKKKKKENSQIIAASSQLQSKVETIEKLLKSKKAEIEKLQQQIQETKSSLTKQLQKNRSMTASHKKQIERINDIHDQQKNANEKKIKKIQKQIKQHIDIIEQKDAMISEGNSKIKKIQQQYNQKQTNIQNALNGVIKQKQKIIKRLQTDQQFAKQKIKQQLGDRGIQSIQQGVNLLIQRKKQQINHARENFQQIQNLKQELKEAKKDYQKSNQKILEEKKVQQQKLQLKLIQQQNQIRQIKQQIQIERGQKVHLQKQIIKHQQQINNGKIEIAAIEKIKKDHEKNIQQIQKKMASIQQNSLQFEKNKLQLKTITQKKDQAEQKIRQLEQKNSGDQRQLNQLRVNANKYRQQKRYLQKLTSTRLLATNKIASIYNILSISLIEEEEYQKIFLKQYQSGNMSEIETLTLSMIDARIKQFRQKIQMIILQAKKNQSNKPLNKTGIDESNLNSIQDLNQSAIRHQQLTDQLTKEIRQQHQILSNLFDASEIESSRMKQSFIYKTTTIPIIRTVGSNNPTKNIKQSRIEESKLQITRYHEDLKVAHKIIICLINIIYQIVKQVIKTGESVVKQMKLWSELLNQSNDDQYKKNVCISIIKLFEAIIKTMELLIQTVIKGFSAENIRLERSNILRDLTQYKNTFMN